MAEIELPWESEHILEWTKCQLQSDKDELPAIVTLVSHLKSPTEFAVIVCINEEKPPQDANEKQGFLAKMKSVANSAASSAAKAQRAVTATNKLSATYDVRFVLPVCLNVDFKINAASISISWSEIGPIIGSEPVFRQIKLARLGEKFINSFKATVEISISKLGNEFVPNGGTCTFDWLWKYQPVVPLPASTARSPTLSSTADLIQPRSPIGKLMAFTWNVAGLAPPDDNPNNVIEHSYSKLKTQLVSFFKNKLGDDLVDVFVLSLQEASPLNAKTVMFKSENFGDAWIDFFHDCLESADRHHKKGEWIKISGIVQVGLVVTAFVRLQRANPRITSPMTSSVKTGTLGLTGNKGSVGLRFAIAYGTSNPLVVSVMNVHLASGDGKGDFRKNELTKIINTSLFDSGNHHFFDSNLSIVNGDLNSRVAETETEGVRIPPDDEILTRSREEAEGFLFCESEVTFPATYKLIPGQEGRLVFFDNRRPGWCDRILYRSNGGRQEDKKSEKFHPIAYDSIREIDYSDHSPVFGIFSLGVASAATASTTSTTRPHEPEVVISRHNDFAIDDNKSSDNDSDLYDN
jgi:hypothetical protein